MIPYFPKQIANKGILVYFISLALVTIAFFRYAMGFKFIVLGIIWVVGFFTLTSLTSKKWQNLPEREFTFTVFVIALLIRIVWVVFSYYFYINLTGIPFEQGAADSLGYHEEANWLSQENWKVAFAYWFSQSGVSDIGYPLILTFVYKIFGPSVMIARLLKALTSAFTCVLLYKFAKRSLGQKVGRMAGLFAFFMPNLIIYCGLHVKETEMIFLLVAFIERADNLVRSRHFNFANVAIVIVLSLSLFLFRTVLAVVALLSFFAALLFTSSKVSGWPRRILLIIIASFALLYGAGGKISSEIENYWESRVENADRKLIQRENSGAQWAKYATGAVLAPLEFVMPLSTMVDVGQQNQMIMHGGNYIKNFIGIFILIALFTMFFVEKNFFNNAMLLSYIVGYLAVLAISGYGNSERFLLPALPGLLVLAAYGVTKLNAKNYKYVRYWYIIVVVMEFGWAFFKFGSRGLL